MVTPPIGAGLVDATVHQEDHHELTADVLRPRPPAWSPRRSALAWSIPRFTKKTTTS